MISAPFYNRAITDTRSSNPVVIDNLPVTANFFNC
jgi:hypothetical protein